MGTPVENNINSTDVHQDVSDVLEMLILNVCHYGVINDTDICIYTSMNAKGDFQGNYKNISVSENMQKSSKFKPKLKTIDIAGQSEINCSKNLQVEVGYATKLCMEMMLKTLDSETESMYEEVTPSVCGDHNVYESMCGAPWLLDVDQDGHESMHEVPASMGIDHNNCESMQEAASSMCIQEVDSKIPQADIFLSLGLIPSTLRHDSFGIDENFTKETNLFDNAEDNKMIRISEMAHNDEALEDIDEDSSLETTDSCKYNAVNIDHQGSFLSQSQHIVEENCPLFVKNGKHLSVKGLSTSSLLPRSDMFHSADDKLVLSPSEQQRKTGCANLEHKFKTEKLWFKSQVKLAECQHPSPSTSGDTAMENRALDASQVIREKWTEDRHATKANPINDSHVNKDIKVGDGHVTKDDSIKDRFVRGDPTKNSHVTRNNTVHDSHVTKDDTVDDSYVTKDNTVDDSHVTKDDTVDDSHVTKDDTLDDSHVTRDNTVDDSHVTRDNKVDDSHVTRNNTVHDSHVTKDDKVDDSYVTKDNTVDDSHVTKDDTVDDSHVTRDNTVDDSHVTRDNKVDDSHVTRDNTVHENHDTKDETLDDSHVLKDNTVEDSHVIKDDTVNDSHVTRDNTVNDSQVTREDTVDLSHATKDDTLDDSQVTREDTVDLSHATKDDTLDDSQVTREDTVDLSHATKDDTLDDSHVLKDDTVEDSHVIKDDTVNDSHVTRDNTVNDSHVTGDDTVHDSQVTREDTVDLSHATKDDTEDDSHVIRDDAIDESDVTRDDIVDDSHVTGDDTEDDSHVNIIDIPNESHVIRVDPVNNNHGIGDSTADNSPIDEEDSRMQEIPSYVVTSVSCDATEGRESCLYIHPIKATMVDGDVDKLVEEEAAVPDMKTSALPDCDDSDSDSHLCMIPGTQSFVPCNFEEDVKGHCHYQEPDTIVSKKRHLNLADDDCEVTVKKPALEGKPSGIVMETCYAAPTVKNGEVHDPSATVHCSLIKDVDDTKIESNEDDNAEPSYSPLVMENDIDQAVPDGRLTVNFSFYEEQTEAVEIVTEKQKSSNDICPSSVKVESSPSQGHPKRLPAEETSGRVFKWKFSPSYEDDDAVLPNGETRQDLCPSALPQLSVCRKPLRVGLSRRQRLNPLHRNLSHKHN